MLNRPDSTEYYPYVSGYIHLVPDGDYISYLAKQLEELNALFAEVSEEQGSYAYAPGKWSIKEIIGHITDTERVMSYRLLRIARGDSDISLPGFDQDSFIQSAAFSELTLETLLADFRAVRKATLTLLTTITDQAWLRKGLVNDNEISARAIAYTLAGHAQHHMNVLRDKYLS
ncbi:DinB family protein [Paenibacillus hexagrammi]|uniref:DinB family protein n=1 Tax=Paenibacillus hexagrammi TaxID=2908839 RepID=A0ABY3SBD2_9BACL|nr:DinB family protein [Paenibacillus sp. YPD9-1]UJF31297.1 DinB family protein [Paenibacillus sp. YPD9-1]